MTKQEDVMNLRGNRDMWGVRAGTETGRNNVNIPLMYDILKKMKDFKESNTVTFI